MTSHPAADRWMAIDPAPATTRGAGRIVGIDAARAFALVGMFAVHIFPVRATDGTATVAGAVTAGRSAALFAVLAGVGIALGTGGVRGLPDGRAHLAAAAGLLVRGVLVAAIGLWLAGIDPPVAVILAYYGLLFLVATPLLRLPPVLLAGGAVLCCALTPVVSHLLRTGLPVGPGDQPGFEALADPGDLVVILGLTGYYPALPWTTYLLTGLAVGRLDLHRLRTAIGLLVGGAALAVGAAVTSALLLGPGGGAMQIAVASGAAALNRQRYGTVPTDTWWWLAVAEAHSGTPLDLAHTTGTALAVLGASLLLARWAQPAAWLPAAVGSMPLTLYTLHVIAVTAYSGNGPDDAVVFACHVGVAVLIGVGLRLADRRGPFEAVVARAGAAARRAVSPTVRTILPATRRSCSAASAAFNSVQSAT